MNAVTGPQEVRDGHLGAVHPGAVAATQVAQVEVALVARDLRVKKRYAAIFDRHLPLGIAPQVGGGRRQWVTPTREFQVRGIGRDRWSCVDHSGDRALHGK